MLNHCLSKVIKLLKDDIQGDGGEGGTGGGGGRREVGILKKGKNRIKIYWYIQVRLECSKVSQVSPKKVILRRR